MIEVLFVVAVIGAVLPLAGDADRRGRLRLVAATLLAISFVGAAGPVAGMLAVPWAAIAVITGLGRLAPAARRGLTRDGASIGLDSAAAFLVVGAVAAMLSRLGIRPFDFGEPIVLLTAVHFHVAGFVLTTVAVRAGERSWAAGRVAVPLLLGGIPATAFGFLGADEIGLAGAWLVAAGGILVGAAHLELAIHSDSGDRWLAAVAGLSLAVTMPLAIAWAMASYAGVPFLPIGAMAATHGALNVAGFAIPASWFWRWAA
ncbi:MAG TPA: YndJ family transporter [Candidatus Limnocylindrales bacterium]|nr:YndJ family transporter [Candidatus Limnocylindrales bacterium]